jgi:hypothetical protein
LTSSVLRLLLLLLLLLLQLLLPLLLLPLLLPAFLLLALPLLELLWARCRGPPISPYCKLQVCAHMPRA